MNFFWAPGQSAATREIIGNLSTREKIRLAALPLLIFVAGVACQWVLMFVMNVYGPYATIAVLAMCLALFHAIRPLLDRQLLNTVYAKKAGITSADIEPVEPDGYEVGIAFAIPAAIIVLIGIIFVCLAMFER